MKILLDENEGKIFFTIFIISLITAISTLIDSEVKMITVYSVMIQSTYEVPYCFAVFVTLGFLLLMIYSLFYDFIELVYNKNKERSVK